MTSSTLCDSNILQRIIEQNLFEQTRNHRNEMLYHEEVQKTRATIKKKTNKKNVRCFAFILRLIESSHSFRLFFY